MSDKEFRNRLMQWSSKHGRMELLAISLDYELGPDEAVAGPGSEVRMGEDAYNSVYNFIGQDHENN